MAQKRLPVRKIREVLWAKAAGVSERDIAAAIGCVRSTVQLCLQRAETAKLVWPLPANWMMRRSKRSFIRGRPR